MHGRGTKQCAHCGTTETAQWRTGPGGEKLCNKCGLYIQRHNKKRPADMPASNSKFGIVSRQLAVQLENKYEERVKREERFLAALDGARPKGKVPNARCKQMELALHHTPQRQEEMKQYYDRMNNVGHINLEDMNSLDLISKVVAEQQYGRLSSLKQRPEVVAPIPPTPPPTVDNMWNSSLDTCVTYQWKSIQDQLGKIQGLVQQQVECGNDGTSGTLDECMSPIESNSSSPIHNKGTLSYVSESESNLKPSEVILLQQQLQQSIQHLGVILSSQSPASSVMSTTPGPSMPGTPTDNPTNCFPTYEEPHLMGTFCKRASEVITCSNSNKVDKFNTLTELMLKLKPGPTSNVASKQLELSLQEQPKLQAEEAKYQKTINNVNPLPMSAYSTFLADGGHVCQSGTKTIHHPPVVTAAHRKRPRSEITTSPPLPRTQLQKIQIKAEEPEATTNVIPNNQPQFSTNQDVNTLVAGISASLAGLIETLSVSQGDANGGIPAPTTTTVAGANSECNRTDAWLQLLGQQCAAHLAGAPVGSTVEYGNANFLTGETVETNMHNTEDVSCEGVEEDTACCDDPMTSIDDRFQFWNDANHNLAYTAIQQQASHFQQCPPACAPSLPSSSLIDTSSLEKRYNPSMFIYPNQANISTSAIGLCEPTDEIRFESPLYLKDEEMELDSVFNGSAFSNMFNDVAA